MGTINLIKFGRSEIKRINIKQSYTYLVDLINENSGELLSPKKIIEKLKEKKFYMKNKVQENPSREISFINSYHFGDLNKEQENYLILKTEISSNWDSDINNSSFWGLTSIDFSFFQFLLKSTYQSNGEIRSSFFHLIKFLIDNKKIMEEMIISRELEEEINKDVLSKNITNLKNRCFFKSGSKDETIANLNNELVNEFFDLWDKDESSNYHSIHTVISKMMNGKFKDFSNGITNLIFGVNSKINSFSKYSKEMEKNPKKVNEFIHSGIKNIKPRIISRIIGGSWNSYKYLIKSHLNALDNIFIINGDDQFLIDNKYKKLIDGIIDGGESLILKLEKDKFYSASELLDFFGLSNETIEIEQQKIMKEFYTINKLKLLFEGIKKFIILKNDKYDYDRRKIAKIIKQHKHVKGKVDFPTFYEFISGMAFLSKEFEDNPAYFQNENSTILETFRARLDTNLCPIRFAAGGRADIQIFSIDKSKFINIEPTTQLRDQTKMELSSVRKHLKKDWEVNNDKNLDLAKAIIVTTKTDQYLETDLQGWNSKNSPKLEIKVFDIDSIIKMLESPKSIFDYINKG